MNEYYGPPCSSKWFRLLRRLITCDIMFHWERCVGAVECGNSRQSQQQLRPIYSKLALLRIHEHPTNKFQIKCMQTDANGGPNKCCRTLIAVRHRKISKKERRDMRACGYTAKTWQCLCFACETENYTLDRCGLRKSTQEFIGSTFHYGRRFVPPSHRLPSLQSNNNEK